MLVEVQSPSTESDDHGPKLDAYKLISTVRTVILVAQERAQVSVHEKQPDGSRVDSVHDAGILDVPVIACRLPLSEIYEELPDV